MRGRVLAQIVRPLVPPAAGRVMGVPTMMKRTAGTVTATAAIKPARPDAGIKPFGREVDQLLACAVFSSRDRLGRRMRSAGAIVPPAAATARTTTGWFWPYPAASDIRPLPPLLGVKPMHCLLRHHRHRGCQADRLH